MFINIIIYFFPLSRTLKRCFVINDEQRDLEREPRMVALNPQLAISLASINISFYCVYGSNSRGGEGRCYIFPLTREYTWTHSGGILMADCVYGQYTQPEWTDNCWLSLGTRTLGPSRRRLSKSVDVCVNPFQYCGVWGRHVFTFTQVIQIRVCVSVVSQPG